MSGGPVGGRPHVPQHPHRTTLLTYRLLLSSRVLGAMSTTIAKHRATPTNPAPARRVAPPPPPLPPVAAAHSCTSADASRSCTSRAPVRPPVVTSGTGVPASRHPVAAFPATVAVPPRRPRQPRTAVKGGGTPAVGGDRPRPAAVSLPLATPTAAVATTGPRRGCAAARPTRPPRRCPPPPRRQRWPCPTAGPPPARAIGAHTRSTRPSSRRLARRDKRMAAGCTW